MTISEQIDALQAKVAELKSSLDASRHETNEQIKARAATARAKAEAAQHTVHGKADQAADHAHTQWQSFKADTSAKMAELRGRIERQRDERDAKAAETDAEAAEDDAADALDYAAWATDQAEAAVLDAAAAIPQGPVLGLDGPDPPCPCQQGTASEPGGFGAVPTAGRSGMTGQDEPNTAERRDSLQLAPLFSCLTIEGFDGQDDPRTVTRLTHCP